MGGSEKSRCCGSYSGISLLGAGVLGDGLRALADGVLGQLSRQQKTDRRLDLPTADRRPLAVPGQMRRLGGDTTEDVVHERVHDGHRLAWDARVGVHLLQYLVYVDPVALFTALPPFLGCGGRRRRLRNALRFLCAFLSNFRCHLRLQRSDNNSVSYNECSAFIANVRATTSRVRAAKSRVRAATWRIRSAT